MYVCMYVWQLQNINQKIQVLQPVDLLQKIASNSSDIFRSGLCWRPRRAYSMLFAEEDPYPPLGGIFHDSRNWMFGKKYTCETPTFSHMCIYIYIDK